MRTTTVLFFVIAAALAAGGTRPLSAAAATHAIRVAPADEYFGRLKMSILGIGNQLRDLALRLQYTPGQGEAILGSAAMVEDALRDWERKYPQDPWLAKDVYQLTSLYSHVHTAHGHSCAARSLHWLLVRYGRTRYGALARAEFRRQVGIR